MLTEPIFERGRLLYEQGRYEQALTEFQNVLAADPGHAEALLMRAYTLIQLNRPQEALETADDLLQLMPDQAVVLDLKARALLHLNRSKEALRYCLDSIQLDPSDADFWGTAAVIYYDDKEFESALARAEEGLRLDPSHPICLNLRNLCLAKLNRAEELNESVEETLGEDPGSAFSHTAAGWALLEKGDHRQARTHFAEALRLSPGFTWAQAGMLEALKAKNPLFRFFLRYYFWSGNLKGQQQWALLIGSFLGIRFINSLDSSVWFINVVQMLLLVFVWLMWFVDPLFNVLMLSDKQGRHLLSDRQRSMYPVVGWLLGLGVISTAAGYVGPDDSPLLSLAFLVGIVMLAVVLPLSAWIETKQPKNQRRLRAVFYVMTATAVLSLVALLSGRDPEMSVFGLFKIEMLLFMFFRNYLLIENKD